MPSIRRTAKITAATPKPVKETREVTVLKRACVTKVNTAYFVNPGDVINLVKNGGGRVYTTILRRSKQHTCTCAGNALGHKQCYHIKHCVGLENARWEAEQAKAALIAEAEEAHMVVVVASQPVVEVTVDLPEELRGHRKTMTVRGPVLPRKGMATRRVEDEAAVTKIVVELAKVREAKAARQLEETPESAEKRRANANLGGTRAFSKLR
jgi:hypothetical protein